MTDREAFEAWAGKREKAATTSAWDYAFRAWQAATAAERERCAKVCEEQAKRYLACLTYAPLAYKNMHSAALQSAFTIRKGP